MFGMKSGKQLFPDFRRVVIFVRIPKRRPSALRRNSNLSIQSRSTTDRRSRSAIAVAETLELIDRIYSDATHGESWQDFLGELNRFLSLNISALEVMDNKGLSPTCFNERHDVPSTQHKVPEPICRENVMVSPRNDKLVAEYLDYYHTIDPLRAKALQDGTTGFVSGASVIQGRRLDESEYFVDFATKRDSYFFFREVIRLGGGESIGFALEREKSRSGFAAEEKSLIAKLRPHLRNASIFRHVLTGVSETDNAILESQQRYGKCGFIVSPSAIIVDQNENASELIDTEVGINSIGNELAFENADAQATFRKFLETGSDKNSKVSTPHILEFQVPLTRYPFDLHCRAIKKTIDFSAYDLSRGHAVVEITSCWHKGWRPIERAINSDALTEREKQVMFCLLSNANEDVIAEKLEISVNTLRTHRKRLYAKIGVNSRSELSEAF